MTKKGWLAVALVAAGASYKLKGGCLNDTMKAPDEKLAAHLDDLCDIARHNVDKPVRGLTELGRYMGKNAGNIYGAWADTIATIEQIPDDAKHDARARVARDRIRKPIFACAQTWSRFADAVQNDEKASAMLERFGERLGRTLEIIGGEGQQLGLDLEFPGSSFGAKALSAGRALVPKP
jgi:hypothetical protein